MARQTHMDLLFGLNRLLIKVKSKRKCKREVLEKIGGFFFASPHQVQNNKPL
jgi:hypothetical protein